MWHGGAGASMPLPVLLMALLLLQCERWHLCHILAAADELLSSCFCCSYIEGLAPCDFYAACPQTHEHH